MVLFTLCQKSREKDGVSGRGEFDAAFVVEGQWQRQLAGDDSSKSPISYRRLMVELVCSMTISRDFFIELHRCASLLHTIFC